MLERDVQGIRGRRGEPGLKTEMEAALFGARFFHAEIFRENPGEVRGEAAFGQQLLPGLERFRQGGRLNCATEFMPGF